MNSPNPELNNLVNKQPNHEQNNILQARQNLIKIMLTNKTAFQNYYRAVFQKNTNITLQEMGYDIKLFSPEDIVNLSILFDNISQLMNNQFQKPVNSQKG